MIFENVLEVSEDSNLEDLTARPVIRHKRSFYRSTQSSSSASSFADWMPFDITEDWWSMLATQPPLQSLRLCCEHMDRGIDIEAKHGSARGGIVLGDIAEAATVLCQNKNRYCMLEMDIYQPPDVDEESNGLGFVNGNQVQTQEGKEYHRAWETKLQCHID